ncbi:MAG: RNA polymerase sigma factor [Planctomycetota bacterium]
MVEPTDPVLASTAALVQQLQSGEDAAFAALYRAFAGVVHGIALAHGPRGAAEDVTQDVFMRAYLRRNELRDPAAFPGWLCTVARNAAVQARRKARRRQARAPRADVNGVASAAPGPERAAIAADDAGRVLDCIAELPAAYRETLVLRLCEGLGGAEIAARTGRTHGSVRVNLTRGMALLRPLLRERGLP